MTWFANTQGKNRPLVGSGKRPHRSRSRVARIAFWPLVLLFTAVDTILIVGAMTVALHQGTNLAWGASASIAVLAAYTGHEAGKQSREARIWGRFPAAGVALMIFFTAIVAGLFLIRWNAGTLTDTSITFDNNNTSDTNDFTHHMTAYALAPMLCATGLIAFLHGFNAKTSLEAEHESVMEKLTKAQQRHVALEADVTRGHLAVAAHQHELRQIAAQEEQHLAAAGALAAEGKAYAHRAIYLALGGPNASGMTDIEPDR